MIDLHTHSAHSDGSDAPEQLVDLAAAAGVTGMALTDHDTTSGIDTAAARAEALGIAFLSGMELSCHTSDRTIHLLAYGIDHHDSELQSRLATQIDSRSARNTLLIERLQALDYDITLDDVHRASGSGTVGRPHFAEVLRQKGYVTSIDQAFEKLLAAGRPAYIERRELAAADAIALIHRHGGVAIWAHPTRHKAVDEHRFRTNLEELTASGLDGIECWYSRFTPDQRRNTARLARKIGLIPTGGSDYHGTYKPDLTLGRGTGDLQIPFEVFDDLRNAIEEIRK